MTRSLHSKSEEVARIAEELLADIELDQLQGAGLILKTMRLARLCGDEDAYFWLRLERDGYTLRSDDPRIFGYLNRAGRAAKGVTCSFGQLVTHGRGTHDNLRHLREAEIASPTKSGLAAHRKQAELQRISVEEDGIIERVQALLHDYVLQVYQETRFSGQAESIFERYKHGVDAKLAQSCAETLKKIPAMFDRLADGDTESISQAFNTCRRLIKAFADALFPASNEPIESDGETVNVGKDKTKNRINAYVSERVESKTVRKRLKDTLSNLYARVCTGVHADVDPHEARALVLQTYLLLGEIVSLPEKAPEPPTATEDDSSDPGTEAGDSKSEKRK